MIKEIETGSVEEYFDKVRNGEVEILVSKIHEESKADPKLRRKYESVFVRGGLWLTFLHHQAEIVTIEFPDLPGWEELSLDDRALLIEVFQVLYLQITDHEDGPRQRGEVLFGLRGRKTQLSAKKLKALLWVFSLLSNQGDA